ncbi:MAG TPA: TIGR02265 family protein [Anaeromyxobacteraceae bacterium]|nr:TIGR02265 family protein [Anaeromyxobacteraceae bacterium]
MSGPSRNRIKGGVLKSRLEFVRARTGEAGLGAVLARLPPADQEALRGWILPTTWYPLDLNLRLDEAIAVVLSPGDRDRLFVEMGRASADSNLGGPQRPYLREGDPHFLLRAAAQIYAAYYGVGRRTYERTGETSAVLRTFDAENVTRTDCLTVVGWHQRAIEMCGGKAVRVEETRCRTRGHPHCEYHCEWT